MRTTFLGAILIGPALVAGSITVTTETPGPTITIGSGILTDSAMLSLGSSPTGTMTFTLFFGFTVDTETVTVNGNGTYNTPTGYTPFQAGTYTWTAAYNGDPANLASTATGGTEVVNQATPGIITVPGGPVVQGSGQPLTDTAMLSGGFNDTGTITFMLHDPFNTVVDTETVTVNGNGTYSTPTGYVPFVAGTYQWTASYSGDGNNTGASSPLGSEPELVASTPEPGSMGMVGLAISSCIFGASRRWAKRLR